MVPTQHSTSTTQARTAIPSYGGLMLRDVTAVAGFGLGSSSVGTPLTAGPGASVPFSYPQGPSVMTSPNPAHPFAGPGASATRASVAATRGTSPTSSYRPSQEGTYRANPGSNPSTGYGGMPSHITNAIKMIQPFYSEGSTLERLELSGTLLKKPRWV
ncbi:unnamed protein product [Phytophthora fragariaefolia]|uniref:Unnamed protein product n=1 Tax=Phytophthora fragariaefolia TaxID=1490495 RepID=A0A9W6X3Y6_9STRA|nr:unnamed protein product [Phytophthora fragariaefolia]